jgi:cytochrome b561
MQTWNTKQAFGWVSVALHWIAALGVLAMIWFGLNAGWTDDNPATKQAHAYFIGVHISLGATLLAFALARVIAHYAQTRPDLPSGEPKPLQAIARLTHNLLLLAIVLQFVSGPLIVWSGAHPINVWNVVAIPSPFAARNHGVHEVAEQIHFVGRWLLFIVIPIHVLGALKHAMLDSDGVLMQMLAPGRALTKP